MHTLGVDRKMMCTSGNAISLSRPARAGWF